MGESLHKPPAACCWVVLFLMEEAGLEPGEQDLPIKVPRLPPAPLYDFRFDAKYIAGFWQQVIHDRFDRNRMHWVVFLDSSDGLSAGTTEFKQRMYRNTNAAEIKDEGTPERGSSQSSGINERLRSQPASEVYPLIFEIGELLF